VIVLDDSAVIAILVEEPEAEALRRIVAAADAVVISSANWLETAIVLDRRDASLIDLFQEFLIAAEVRVEPVTAGAAIRALDAFRRYGRGSRHFAKLNFGECFA
jgi:ribonuclease VapC